MEYEQLEQGSRSILRCIKSQDVSAFYEIVSPSVLLITHFPIPPLPSVNMELTEAFRQRGTPARTRFQQLLAEQERTQKGQQQRYLEHLKRIEEGAGGDPAAVEAAASAAAANAAVESGAGPGDDNDTNRSSPRKNPKLDKATLAVNSMMKRVKPQGGGHLQEALGVSLYFNPELENLPANDPKAADYVTHIDISEGPLLVTSRFFELLTWTSHGDFISETQLQLKPRKAFLQDNEVLPPPPAPRTLDERVRMLGQQFTDRNQTLSHLNVVWGRETLLFSDYYYFSEGKIVTIHRRFVPLTDMLEYPLPEMPNASATHHVEVIREELLKLYGKSATKVDTVSHSLPLLDFSFLDLQDCVKLLQSKPLNGRKHKPKPLRPAVDPRLARGVFLTTENDPTMQGKVNRTLIKAKNKKGEEEAYEFVAGQRLTFLDNDDNAGDSIESLIENCDKYDATAVRISSCHMREKMEKLPMVLRGMIANAFVSIHSLDLSDNHISKLPSFASLPLQKLLLHGNQISEWNDVEVNVCPLPFLTALTLHGNPIAEQNPSYWGFALSRLLRHPNRIVRLKQLDFVTLTAQDYNVAGSYEMFTTGSKSILNAQKAKTGVKGRGRAEGKQQQ